MRKEVVGNDRIIIRTSPGITHYQPASSIRQRGVICNDYSACRMIKMDAVVPGVNYEVINDSSMRIRVIEPMNRNVAGALGRVDQTDIVNKVSDHLVVCCRVIAVHNSGAAQVAGCGRRPCDIVDMVADVAHKRSIIVEAYTPN